MTYTKNNRDANEAALVELWRRAGCLWIPMDRHAGFDGLLVAPSGIHIVEIKNPAQRWTLTPAERKRREEVEAAGQTYNIVETDSDALALLARKG